MRLLYAEDEPDLNRIVTKKLAEEGFSVDSCFDGREAIDNIQFTDYDVAILDIMLPQADGFAILKELRKLKKNTPVLFLTARDSIEDRVKGLDSGANDYLVKPFSLEYLMYNKEKVLSREKIENHIWNYDYEGGTNVIDVYIRYLRKKIDNGFDTKLIHTVRGAGYVIREDKT